MDSVASIGKTLVFNTVVHGNLPNDGIEIHLFDKLIRKERLVNVV